MAPRDKHLSESDLVAGRDNAAFPAEQRIHLETCDECRAHLEVVASDAFRRISIDAPQFASHTGTSGDPVRGELWRVHHGDVADLALVWSTPRPWIRVFPASTDADYGDERTVIVDATDNSLAVEIGVWAGMGFDLPPEFFDCGVGQVSDSAVKAIAVVHGARGEPVTGIRVGAPITSPLDERFEYRAELTGRFTAMADAVLSEEDSGPDRYGAGARDAAIRSQRRRRQSSTDD